MRYAFGEGTMYTPYAAIVGIGMTCIVSSKQQ